MNRTGKILLNGSLCLGSLLFVLIILEITLAFLGLPRFYKDHDSTEQFVVVNDPGGSFYINRPSSDITFGYDGNPRGYFNAANQMVHKTNSSGFRGNEFFYDKPPRTFRIAFLGDSFTFGEGVKFEDTYPEKVAQLLNQKYGVSDRSFESYNFGVGGYNTTRELFLLKRVVLKTQPDIVVLGYALNDAEPSRFQVISSDDLSTQWRREDFVHEGVPDKEPPQGLWFRSRIIKWFWQLFSMSKLNAQTENYYKELYRPGKPAWEATKTSLRELIRTCENSRIHCFIICFPVLHKLNSEYPFKDIHALIRQEIRPEKHPYVHFIDLFEFLKGRNARDLWVHPTDQHPNEIAQAIAAKALADGISKLRPWDRQDPSAVPTS